MSASDITIVINPLQSLATFEEKLEATISSYQRRESTVSSTKRKQKKIGITPVGLSSPLAEQNMETILRNLDNYSFDDVMLLVWCKRTVFHKSEPPKNNDKSVIPLFFQYWIELYLKKPDQVLSMHLPTISKYGGWRDLTTIYTCTRQMESMYPTEVTLLENLKKACVKMVGDQLEHDHRVVLEQSRDGSSVEEKQITMKDQDWISTCAKEAPQISNNNKKSTTIMAKEIALYLHPSSTIIDDTEQVLSAWKCYAYKSYRCLLSTVYQMLEKVSSTLVEEQIRSNKRKDRGLFCTRKEREILLTAPFSSHIINPEPQSVIPRALKEFEPLLEHLSSNKPGPDDDNQPIVFPRGTIMSGGRLDLCKQVVGPQGVQPLLNAMKHNSYISRLLLGNNVVGLPGAEAISQYICSNPDSHIDTWYIACNRFDSESMSLICDALAVDTKVIALWLKRNPILAVGAVHIARMLTTNTCLQTLDLLNTGLMDDG